MHRPSQPPSSHQKKHNYCAEHLTLPRPLQRNKKILHIKWRKNIHVSSKIPPITYIMFHPLFTHCKRYLYCFLGIGALL